MLVPLARILRLIGTALVVIFLAFLIFAWASLATPPTMTSWTSLILWLLAAPFVIAVSIAWFRRRKPDRDLTPLAVSLLLSAGLYQYNLIRVAHEQRTNTWWQDEQTIERYLLTNTPIGTPEDRVKVWLQRATDIRQPHPNEIDAVLATYQDLVFGVSVTGVYTFDDAHRLLAIGVTKHVDAL